MSSGFAVVIDASVAIAICARETGRDTLASSELARYAAAAFAFYAPGVIVAETLYILCGKLQTGQLTATEHAQAVIDFQALMTKLLPPPSGEAALVAQAEAVRTGYGCSRSADGVYIALAEELARTMSAEILTFDTAMTNQVAMHVPTVSVRTLII